MSWHIGGGVSKEDDYREQALVSRVIESARRGVAIIGPSRIGKTSLLYRIEEHLGLESKAIVLVDEVPEATLERMREGQTWFLFDEAQQLADWSDTDLAKLRQRIGGHPFVFAGWPTMLKSQMSWELRRLLDNARIELVPPFGLEETARMVRRSQSRAPWDCSEEVVQAIYEATAGFPDLIARLCRYLSDQGRKAPRFPKERDLEGFLESCSSSGDPFQWLYDSLPVRQREVIDAHRGGRRTRLDALHELGLVSGSPARFSGSLFQLIWKPKSQWQPVTIPKVSEQKRAVSSTTSVPRPAFTWLHVSDLHFGGGFVSHQYSRQEILKALLEDVRADVKEGRLGRPDLILVTGDIAFQAAPQEYHEARAWLSQLAEAVGSSVADLRLVPGNHDVDRKLASEDAVQGLHFKPRSAAAFAPRDQRPVALLDGSLKSAQSRPLLRQKLDAYVSFVNALAPTHPKAADGVPLDWAEPLDPVPQRPGKLWLVGMCSVWVSDAQDGERRLFLGEQQLRALEGVGKEDLLLLLTHHPPGWLHGDCEALLLDRLAERAHHIHLCGHVHNATALALRGLGRSKESFRLVAGAGHGDSAQEHAYAWGALRWNEVEEVWELGWAPRSFVPGEGWRKDRNRYELDDEGFAWAPLSKLGWGPPKAG